MATQVSDQPEPWSHLPGKVVMVTGASSGLGRLDLGRAGCFVVAAARRVDRLKSLCDEINRLTFTGPHLTRAVPVELDFCSDGPTIGKSVKSAFGRIDALINNAGVRGDALGLGKVKIRVSCISPGIFKSEITENLMEKEWLRNVNQKIIPLKTTGTSDPALTSLVRYLIHDSSEYVSGNVFIVDAGATLPGLPIFSSL